MKITFTCAYVFAVFAAYGAEVPTTTILAESTPVHLRLAQTISSADEETGQTIQFSVVDAIKVNDVILIAEGAPATGTITEAQGKRRMGRAGKLSFSIDRVRAVDGQWVNLTYQPHNTHGGSHAVGTGVAVGVTAVVFWPAAPAFLLIKGKDRTVNAGMTFQVFTEGNHTMGVADRVMKDTQLSNAGKGKPDKW